MGCDQLRVDDDVLLSRSLSRAGAADGDHLGGGITGELAPDDGGGLGSSASATGRARHHQAREGAAMGVTSGYETQVSDASGAKRARERARSRTGAVRVVGLSRELTTCRRACRRACRHAWFGAVMAKGRSICAAPRGASSLLSPP